MTQEQARVKSLEAMACAWILIRDLIKMDSNISKLNTRESIEREIDNIQRDVDKAIVANQQQVE